MFSVARTVIFFSLLYQAVGFARLLMVADFFGAGPQLDAYYLGLVIPAFLVGLSSAFLQTGFVPAYINAKIKSGEVAATRLRNVTLTWTLGLLALFAGTLSFGKREVMSLLWPHIDESIRAALQSSFVVLLWTTPFNGIADALAMLLNAEGRFAAAAAAPVAHVAVSSVALIMLGQFGLNGLIMSLYAGLFVQVAVLVVALWRSGIPFRPRLLVPVALPRLIVLIGLPVLGSSVLANCIPAFIQIVAARTGPGGVSAFGYANRLHSAVVQTVVTSCSTVLLPHFARLVAENRTHELRLTLSRIFAATLIFFLGTLVFVASSGSDLVQLLLHRGRFTQSNGILVWHVWLALTTGLMGITWGIFLVRLFQAKQQAWTITSLTVVSVVLNVLLAYLLMPRLGVAGVALANAISYTVVMAISHVIMVRSVGRFAVRKTFGFVAAAVSANAGALAVAVFIGRSLPGSPAVPVVMAQLLVIVIANLAVIRLPPLSVSIRALVRS